MKSIEKLILISIFLILFSMQAFSLSIANEDNSVVNIVRFDQMLFSLNSDNFDDKWKRWNNNLDSVPFYYFKFHIGMDMDSDSIELDILRFVNSPIVLEYKTSIDNKFEDLDGIESSFNNIFIRYKQLLPHQIYPKSIITLPFDGVVDEYNGHLLVGLNNYLSESDHPEFGSSYQYIRHRFDERFITMDGMELWFSNTLLGYNDNRNQNFLDHLIFKGKIMYLMYICSPSSNLSDIMRYSYEDIKWCKANQFNIWNEVLKLNIMYDYNYNNFRTFFESAPFTKGMPRESPSRLGYWIGYQIVRSYMKTNAEIDFRELWLNIDSKRILLESKYQPEINKKKLPEVSIFRQYWWLIFILLFVLCVSYLLYFNKII